jgi:CobQ-like glutamine amidotransferase family enzyme
MLKRFVAVFWPQHSKKASAFEGLVIISYVGGIALWARVSWTQRLLGKLIQVEYWHFVRLQELDKALFQRENVRE